MRKLRMTIILVVLIGGIFALSSTIPVSAARKTAVEFFEDLTPADRLLIREAMDMAIPRQQIIDSVLLGNGALLATPIEANAIGYDSAIQPRAFDIEGALDKMESAFGYRYNDTAEDREDQKGYFSMVIMAPTSRDDRMQWAALVTKCFQEIGIDVTLKYANWNVAVTVFTPPAENAGFDYEHGGYDAFFIGWTGSPQSDVSQWFGEDNWAPIGTNIGYIDDPVVDAIIETSLTNQDKQKRLDALVDFQEYFYDNLPYFIVLQLMDLWALDPELEGVSLSFDYPNFGNWTHAKKDAITVQTPGEIVDCNPHMIGSYYDWLAGSINGGYYGSLLTSYPADPGVYYGDIAKSWTVSADGLVWTFTLNEGIKFSDGELCTVEDVKFSYEQFINPAVIAYGGTGLAPYLNASNIKIIDDDTIEFTMNKFYAYGESHWTLSILSKKEMSVVPDASWDKHASTTTYAPVGTGPYKMDKANSDVSESQVKMILNTFYDNTIRDPKGQFNNLDRIPVINLKLVKTAASCVADLKSGAINIIDSNVAIQPFLKEINDSSWGRLESSLGWGHQGFYVNQRNPEWGMHAADYDPREMYPEDYAAAPFDLTSVLIAILMLASIQIIRSKKKKK